MPFRTAAALAALCLAPIALPAQDATSPLRGNETDETVHSSRSGLTYANWGEYYRSAEFRANASRCGSRISPNALAAVRGATGADCTFNLTNPDVIYDGPTGIVYRIPVVFHIIQRTNGTGNIPDDRVLEQIQILNEDFNAIAGTNGAQSTNARIEFFLATTDPNGQPSTGITRSTNNTWYNDGGNYWNTLAWDTSRYVNIYTNSAGGALGYVPDLPQGGLAGQNADRVVIYYESLGRNPAFSPYDLGRTATHEIGHYLGLYHPFDNGCGTAGAPGCYSSGDRICDLRDMNQPDFGCSTSNQCGGTSPLDNFMNYSDDACMNKFTPEQVRRMRCSLINYRPQLFQTADDGSGDNWAVQ
jgi:hypothetical protein